MGGDVNSQDRCASATLNADLDMTHFYRNVPKLGHVAVSRHAQKRMEEDNISQEAFERVLLAPVKPDVRDGTDILWRQRDGIRIVILEKTQLRRPARNSSRPCTASKRRRRRDRLFHSYRSRL